jgi:hypothetical protein
MGTTFNMSLYRADVEYIPKFFDNKLQTAFRSSQLEQTLKSTIGSPTSHYADFHRTLLIPGLIIAFKKYEHLDPAHKNYVEHELDQIIFDASSHPLQVENLPSGLSAVTFGSIKPLLANEVVNSHDDFTPNNLTHYLFGIVLDQQQYVQSGR